MVKSMFKSIVRIIIPTLSFTNSIYESSIINPPQILERDISLNKNDLNHDFIVDKNNNDTNSQTVNFNIGGTNILTLN